MGKTSAVTRLGYVHLRVTDLEEARNHYSNTLGMEVVHEEPGKLWLKCWDEWDHHSLVLEEGGIGLVKLGYKVETNDDLATFENRAQQFGATTGRFSAGDLRNPGFSPAGTADCVTSANGGCVRITLTAHPALLESCIGVQSSYSRPK